MEANEKNYPNRRKPWTAVFLTLVMPGLGHIYCGNISNGLVIMLVIAMLSSVWMVGTLHENTPTIPFFLMMWGIILIATFFAVIDAYRKARRTRYDYKLKDYNRIGIYLALIWIGCAGTIGYIAIIKLNMYEAFRISANSMAPTIFEGDRTLAGKMSYDSSNPQRGDVVLFKDPQNRRISNIKRIVALEGDTVEVRNGKLLINNEPLKSEWTEKKTILINNKKVEGNVYWETNGSVRYQVFISKDDLQKGNCGPVKVPPYHCFVMGDNRNYSKDSRAYGALSYGAIEGKFRSIYWPYHRRASLNAKIMD